MRILWANFYCLLDTSSGASMSVRQIMTELVETGHEVRIIGATVFDSPKGVSLFGPSWEKIAKMDRLSFIDVNDGKLTHSLLLTKSTHRSELSHEEQSAWVTRYRYELTYFKPEFIFFYGGGPGDFIPAEARSYGIPCGAYLVNGTFEGPRWCRDVDTFITDTQATRDYYRDKLNINPYPIGKFIEPDKIAARHERKTLLYVNPSLAKGAVITMMMAQALLDQGSDIPIEIVESRGDWDVVRQAVNKTLGWPSDYCPKNIKIIPNTADMGAVYARARVLFAPSLWWESGARVIAEAQLNGIPVVATNYGGNPEMVGNGGVIFTLPPTCHQKPYLTVPTMDGLKPIADKIAQMFSDETYYHRLSQAALANAELLSNRKTNVQKLEAHIQGLVDRKKPWQAPSLPTPAYEPYDRTKPFGEQSFYTPLPKGARGLFIDCGGYDGCSAIKFITENPQFDCITFEPNPDLWSYYDEVPTTLIKKGIAGATGTRSFTIDSLDFDGSSLIEEKRIDYRGVIDNAQFPKITIDCVDIDEVIRAASSYDVIILKLDVEGAEYEVLERLLETGNISRVHKLYVEWHWEKCGMLYAQHEALLQKLEGYFEFEEWDALNFAIHNQSAERVKSRSDFVRTFLRNPVSKYQKKPEELLVWSH